MSVASGAAGWLGAPVPTATVKQRLGAALVVSLFVIGVYVFSAAQSGAVANGQIVTTNKYPFAVKLTMTGIPTASGGKRNSACSASLVAPGWIITAGHCFTDKNGKRVSRPVADLTTATVGRADVRDTSRGHVSKIVEVKQAPGGADIAVARIATPVRDVAPLRLNISIPKSGQVLRLTGYGSVTGTNPKPVNAMRTGQFTIKSVGSKTISVTGRSPKRNTSACSFDSGAPYFAETSRGPRLVSVESNGPTCPHSANETTTRVDVLETWIRTTTGAK
jgi:secreted trypsin-like serine protease